MYPYNRNTQRYNTPLEVQEAPQNAPTDKQQNALAKDQHLLELLTLSLQDTADLAERYASLMQNSAYASSSNVFKTLYLDEIKHKNQLRDAIYLITGERHTDPVVGVSPSVSDDILLEDTLLLELDNGDFYRSLSLAMPSQSLQDILFEIFSDKLNHSNALCYLFSKYNGK